MGKIEFDVKSFYAAIDGQRQSKRFTWKQVAEQSGISASTLTRMAQGRRPDVDSLAALLAWSGLKAELFVQGGKDPTELEPLAQMTAYVRVDPNLTPEAAATLEVIIKASYERLRTY